jgi:hypothetical protein
MLDLASLARRRAVRIASPLALAGALAAARYDVRVPAPGARATV